MGGAIGLLIGFFLGVFRLFFNTFKYRWAFPTALLVLLLVVVLWFEIAVQCLLVIGAVGDHSAYWGQHLFLLFLLIPGLGGFFYGAVLAWTGTTDFYGHLDSFKETSFYLSFLILCGTFVYGLCLSYAYIITIWPLWVSAGSFLLIPIWTSMPIWCPVYEGYQTDNWQSLIKVLSLLGLCLILALPRMLGDAHKKK